MLNDASVFTKVIIAVGYTDLRRGIEGLATTIKSKYTSILMRRMYSFSSAVRVRTG